jgi:MFS family permease
LAFFFFASAYWALLPLVARTQLGEGPSGYGYLLGVIGLAAVLGALLLQGLERRLGPDRVVIAGTVGTAIAVALFGAAQNWWLAFLASLLAGASWITVVASLNVSAQVALPDWVRARGLAIFVSVCFGALALGSAFWGLVGNLIGLSEAHFLAAAGLLAAIPVASRWKLHTGAGIDLAPSMHWPAPAISLPLDYDRGPVLVTIEYHVAAQDRAVFLKQAEKLGQERKRDGAYAWGIFEDAEKKERFVEAFLLESWAEHLRQHGRVTKAGQGLQSSVTTFNRGPPVVSHLVAALPLASTHSNFDDCADSGP